MNRLLAILLVTMTMVLLCRSAEETTVIGEGMADADLKNAREIALTDALRRAVEKGVGQKIISDTAINNYQLTYDRVFTSAVGYVREYWIIGESSDQKLYHVTVRAKVGKDKVNDKDVLQMLVQRMNSPRVVVEYDSDIVGLEQRQQPDLSGMVRELALKYQMQVVDPGKVSRAEARRRQRDKLAGRDDRADWRDIRANTDLALTVAIGGEYLGDTSTFGAALKKYSIGANLSATWESTGETITELTIPTVTRTTSQGLREATERLLRDGVPVRIEENGKEEVVTKNVDYFFRRIIIRWLFEQDLGSHRYLEFDKIPQAAFDDLVNILKQTNNISKVYVREFDGMGISTIDVNSRIEAQALKDIVLKQLPGWQLDRLERNYLQFSSPVAGP